MRLRSLQSATARNEGTFTLTQRCPSRYFPHSAHISFALLVSASTFSGAYIHHFVLKGIETDPVGDCSGTDTSIWVGGEGLYESALIFSTIPSPSPRPPLTLHVCTRVTHYLSSFPPTSFSATERRPACHGVASHKRLPAI